MASDLAGLDEEMREMLSCTPRAGGAASPSGSAAEPYAASPLRCHNDCEAGVGAAPLLREHPHHRDMVLMRLAGFTTKEIAAELDMTPAAVNTVLRQPWARKRIIEHIHKSREQLMATLEREAAASVLTLVELRDDEQAPKAVRRQASDSLLDRYLGKAPQTVNLNKTDVPQDLTELQRRLDAAKAEEKRLRGN